MGWLIGGIALVVVLMLVGLAVLGLGLNAALTHDLVTTDFARSAEPFSTSDGHPYAFLLQDGTYAITATSPPSGPDGLALSRAQFTREAFVADVSVTVSDVDHPTDDLVGVGCDETVEPGATFDAGFVFLVGESRYAIIRYDASSVWSRSSWFDDSIASTGGAPTLQPGDTLTLRCTAELLDQNVATLTASVNGEQVLEATSRRAHPGTGFLAMTLVFAASQSGDEARFDNAIASVPG